MKLTPSSIALRSTAFEASRSGGSPKIPGPVIRIAPYPMRRTSRSPPRVSVPAAAAGCSEASATHGSYPSRPGSQTACGRLPSPPASQHSPRDGSRNTTHGRVRDRPRPDREADTRRAREARAAHTALARVLGASEECDARRRPVVVPVDRAVAGVRRARRGLEGVGRRRQRVLGLPQWVRRRLRRAREPESRRRRRGASQERHPLRGADRGIDRRRGGARAPLQAAAVAVHQLGHRGDDGRRAPRPRRHGPRRDPEDRGLLPRPPRRGNGLRVSGARRARRPRRPARNPLRGGLSPRDHGPHQARSRSTTPTRSSPS